jgi:GMP synthase-like glutamine amidotransferase
MRVGLLMCDHVDDRFRDIAGDYDEMFVTLLGPRAEGDVEFVVYDVVAGELPASTKECDGWLITGSRASAYDDEAWIHALSAFVRDLHAAHAPTVGICFGHQLLAHALGGRVEKAASGWGVGAHFVDGEVPGRLLFMHQDQVVELPAGAEVLGASAHCPVAMFSFDSMVGVQGHPEFSVAFEQALIDAREARIGADATTAALASLQEPTDEDAVARWLLRVLSGTA